MLRLVWEQDAVVSPGKRWTNKPYSHSSTPIRCAHMPAQCSISEAAVVDASVVSPTQARAIRSEFEANRNLVSRPVLLLAALHLPVESIIDCQRLHNAWQQTLSSLLA